MGEIEEVVLEHAVLNSDLSDPANGPTAMKHIRQQVKSCSKYSIRIFILATYVLCIHKYSNMSLRLYTSICGYIKCFVLYRRPYLVIWRGLV